MDKEGFPAIAILALSQRQKGTVGNKCPHSKATVEEQIKILASSRGVTVHNKTSHCYLGHQGIRLVIIYPLFHFSLHRGTGLYALEESKAAGPSRDDGVVVKTKGFIVALPFQASFLLNIQK